MINRQHRFHGYDSLGHVYKNGITARGPLFAIKAMPNPKRSSYRLAVVVSTKVSKSAVVRNRIRRRLYEAVRQLGTDIKGPFDIVLIAFHSSISNEPDQSLARQVKKQLTDAGVLAKRLKG